MEPMRASSGEVIGNFAERVLARANELGETVTGCHNDILFEANPGDLPKAVAARWYDQQHERERKMKEQSDRRHTLVMEVLRCAARWARARTECNEIQLAGDLSNKDALVVVYALLVKAEDDLLAAVAACRLEEKENPYGQSERREPDGVPAAEPTGTTGELPPDEDRH